MAFLRTRCSMQRILRCSSGRRSFGRIGTPMWVIRMGWRRSKVCCVGDEDSSCRCPSRRDVVEATRSRARGRCLGPGRCLARRLLAVCVLLGGLGDVRVAIGEFELGSCSAGSIVGWLRSCWEFDRGLLIEGRLAGLEVGRAGWFRGLCCWCWLARWFGCVR